MRRLNDRAYNILAAEVKRLVQDPLESVRRDIILRRLDRLRAQEGTPLTAEEIKAEIEDIFPDFDRKILQKAAKANRGSGPLGLVGGLLGGMAIAAGGIWILNLPYPMIRWPVARTVPIVLLPSYISMDHNYRQAIANVEQADQLINQATSAQDIELGAERAQAAQKNLDKLPVWFLGYFPRTYCTWFSCTWRFTYDEFASARRATARIEAKAFQEDNALKLLSEGTTKVDSAQQQYQSATDTQVKSAALANWQKGMDMLYEIPSDTLAGRMSKTKLEAYQRDFSQVSGLVAGGNRSTTLIEAAKEFAWTASLEAQNPPHSQEKWKRISELWEQAISRLEQVPVEDIGYGEAQRMLAEYQNKLGVVKEQQSYEQISQQAFESAQAQNIALGKRVDYLSTNEYISELQSIAQDLSKVQPGTTAYASAQQMLGAVQTQLQKATSSAD
jgi:hypothetical protein